MVAPLSKPRIASLSSAPCSSRHSSTSFGFEPAHSHNAALKLAGRILDSSPSPSHNLFATRGSIGTTTHLLVSVPRTFYTPLQVREPAETPLWPSGVDPTLYRPSLFTGAACQVRHAVLIVLWLPPIQTHLASSRPTLQPRSRHILCTSCDEPHSEQPSILVVQSQA